MSESWEDDDPFAQSDDGNEPPPVPASTRSPEPRKADLPRSNSRGSNTGSRLSVNAQPQEHSEEVQMPIIRGAQPNMSRPDVEICLSGSKLIHGVDGFWHDVTDQGELMNAVHPVIAENMNLRERAKLLVRLVAENEYQNDRVTTEIKECNDVIKELKRLLGEPIPDSSDEDSAGEEDEEEAESDTV